MKERSVARRYARALAQTAGNDEEFESTLEEIEMIGELVRTNSLLRALMQTPGVSRARRVKVLETVISAGGLSDRTSRFLRLLADNERFPVYGEIVTALRSIRDERKGIVEAEITTAVPLDASLESQWERSLSGVTGRTIRLSKRVDPKILGGAVARIGSKVFDGSVRNRLTALRRQMTGR